MAEQQERCETCRFWKRGDDVTSAADTTTAPNPWGDCRRYAPRGPMVIPEQFQVADSFVGTRKTDWCGEYQPAPVPARIEERE